MTVRKAIVYVCLIIALLIGLIARQQMQIKELEAQIADTEHRLQVRSLVNDLRVPFEAIYYDSKAMREICEIRRQSLEKMQVKEFISYRDIFARSAEEVMRGEVNILGVNKGKNGRIYSDVAVLKYGAEATFEKVWFDRAPRPIGNLKSDFKNNIRLGKYYNEHPEEFDKVIKPWVLRLTRSTNVDTSLTACEILLNKGHRDEEIKEALGQVIERLPSKRYVQSWDIKRAKGLNDQYKLGIDLGEVESGG